MEGMMGGHSALYEPVVTELKDGWLRMVCRTLMGRFYEVLSEDGGVNWSIPRPTEIASSDSPCFIRRVPSKGDLVMIWNQISGEEILRGLKRSRICVAISSDGGYVDELQDDRFQRASFGRPYRTSPDPPLSFPGGCGGGPDRLRLLRLPRDRFCGGDGPVFLQRTDNEAGVRVERSDADSGGTGRVLEGERLSGIVAL